METVVKYSTQLTYVQERKTANTKYFYSLKT